MPIINNIQSEAESSYISEVYKLKTAHPEIASKQKLHDLISQRGIKKDIYFKMIFRDMKKKISRVKKQIANTAENHSNIYS
jgi:hypothetical protein